jgi:hypothetical protein
MKLAITAAPTLRLPALAQEATARSWRLAGLLLAVGFPVLFWTSVLALVGCVLGIEIRSGTLAAVSLTIGIFCYIGASLVMAAREQPVKPGACHSAPTPDTSPPERPDLFTPGRGTSTRVRVRR